MRFLAMHHMGSPRGQGPCKAPGRAPALSGGLVLVSESEKENCAEFKGRATAGVGVWNMHFVLKNLRNLI